MREKKYTTKEVAEHYGVCRDTVLAWIKGGILPAINMARPDACRPNYRVRLSDLDVFEKRRTTGPSEPPRTRSKKRSVSDAEVRELLN